MNKHYDVKSIRVEGNHLFLNVDGVERRFQLDGISDAFGDASEKEKQTFEVSPSGYGIHWPLLDEDISIDGLLGIQHSPEGIRKTA